MLSMYTINGVPNAEIGSLCVDERAIFGSDKVGGAITADGEPTIIFW